MTIFKTIFKTLNKNASSFTITDEAISNNSIFEVYPSDDSVILADVTVSGTTANITFDSAAEYNIPCAVFINNLVGAYEPESGLPDTTGHPGNILRVNNQLQPYWAIPDSSGIIYKEHSVKNELDSLNIEADSLDDRVTALEDAPPPSTYVELTKEEYDALPDSKLTDGIQYFIKDWSEEAEGYNISTTEAKTGRKIFGKDIYTCAYPFSGAIATSGTNLGSSVITNISSIASVVNAYTVRTETLSTTPLAVYTPSVNTLNFRAMYGITAVNDMYIILEYTKVGE